MPTIPDEVSDDSLCDKIGDDVEFAVVNSFSAAYFITVCPYPVIVENWKHRLSGKARRRYQAEFTPAERGVISSYHARFAAWYQGRGGCGRVEISMTTLAVLLRAVQFFASL